MRKKHRILIILIALLTVIVSQSVSAQSGDSEYFPETGHYLEEDFFTFYHENPFARLVYGLPITEAYPDPESGRLVQYFDNVRFEFVAENPLGAKVVLTPLGQALYQQGTVIPDLTAATPNCHQDEDWLYPVCSSFYTFFTRYGGEGQFGLPVSSLEYLRGRLVQSFEFAQLVWMPENPERARIVVAPLGLRHFYASDAEIIHLQPIRNFEYNLNINNIGVKAFTKYAVVSSGSSQEIDVIARDQNNAPLTNGIVHITVRYPDNSKTNSDVLATDEFGLANLAFRTQSAQTGPVEVIVRVTYNDLESIAVTSFRIGY
jgi:hypothetical protein